MNENNNVFLDGTKIDSWFYEIKPSKIENFKNKYLVTDFGIYPDKNLYTKEIHVIVNDKYYNFDCEKTINYDC